MIERVIAFFALAFALFAACSARSTPANDAGRCVVFVVAPDAGAIPVPPNPGF